MTQDLVIKICGIKTREMAEHVAAAGADMIGFAHFEKSPRHLPLEAVAALAGALEGRIETVVLMVDPDDRLLDLAAATGVDWLQLHGHESVERVAEAGTRTGRKILKVLPIGGSADVARLPEYHAVADRLLLDAKPPRNATRPGGLGKTFDWSLLETLDRSIPFMLSGGLTIDNVADAVETVRPFGIDVSSGVERIKGEKDAELVTAFIARARAAQARQEKAL
ncbi:phosphoribosylanthranilate isomerase [Pelagibacterium xiamenense]|uniref:phosphoribosylanthranilate isomerase n=1 Tax=Pelagibacterium xiamenense TaxID=2901140 RepID=UPI001E2BF539|nr:phosphoribosylanthranilate isomerase [Pelagibacterium xiamenense]MCD7058575.1 phosphoribosylanthranilate isomerase [Pelagibacterium xiamenense]